MASHLSFTSSHLLICVPQTSCHHIVISRYKTPCLCPPPFVHTHHPRDLMHCMSSLMCSVSLLCTPTSVVVYHIVNFSCYTVVVHSTYMTWSSPYHICLLYHFQLDFMFTSSLSAHPCVLPPSPHVPRHVCSYVIGNYNLYSILAHDTAWLR